MKLKPEAQTRFDAAQAALEALGMTVFELRAMTLAHEMVEAADEQAIAVVDELIEVMATDSGAALEQWIDELNDARAFIQE